MLASPLSPYLIVTCALTLAACSSSSTDRAGQIEEGLTPQGRIVSLDANGDVPRDLNIVTGPGSNSASYKRLVNGNGFAYQMGRQRGTERFLGVAGLAPTTEVGDVPTDATASYTGSYNLAYADSSRFEKNASGDITLDANFVTGTLQGQSGRLTIKGDIDGNNVTGSARYREVDGFFAGRIGEERTVGAFAGHTDEAVLAGGLIAERDE